tara:strand:- start:1064 stop:1456 length:393 start_codon:yes stop_codon:yes gene_type:complete
VSSNQGLYAQLLKRSSKKTDSNNDRYGFKRGGSRFHGKTDKKPKTSDDRDRAPAGPVVREGRVAKLDDVDRELAYRPPVQNQVTTWKPPTFWEIMGDLGLRVVEVGIASIAQEIAYFFTRRRFMPSYLRG